jgi:DNA-binding response OmpR family regulator
MLELLGDVLDAPEGPPDVILLDVMMPNYSGLGVLLTLHRLKLGSRIIMMTAQTDPSIRQYAERFGALGVFEKPFEIDDLRTTLFYLGRARAEGLGERKDAPPTQS